MLRCVVLFLATGLVSAFFTNGLHKNIPVRPQWGSSYMVKGIIHLPRSGVEEHFQAWLDGTNWRSRVDYNNGTVKTYQVPQKDKNKGDLIKIFPFSDENKLNVPTCIVATCNDYMPQPGLPDTSGFKKMGSEDFFGVEAFKWQRERLVRGSHKTVDSLWVKYEQHTSRRTLRAIPLKYESQQIDTDKGTLVDHFFFHYTNYIVEDIDPTTFAIDVSCYPHSDGVMNPIKELVDNTHINHAEKEFDQFKSQHNRRYQTGEHNKRLAIFRHNLRVGTIEKVVHICGKNILVISCITNYVSPGTIISICSVHRLSLLPQELYIQSHNRAGHSYTLEVNHLADRTPEERAAMRGLHRAFPPYKTGLPFPYSDVEMEQLIKEVPEEFDWRLHGAVTPVKDQGFCGSCWAFGAVGAVEGALFLHSKRLVRLSEQALMDCSWGFQNAACGGGEPERAFSWIVKHGLPSDEAYGGYLEQYGSCHIENVKKTALIDNFVKVTPNDEQALRLAIFKHGPIAVGVDASHNSFTFYSQGVYYEPHCNSVNLDHAVLAVGFGIQNGQKYWLVKNSWGPQWGSNGYILMSTKGNNCGIQTDAAYVTISK